MIPTCYRLGGSKAFGLGLLVPPFHSILAFDSFTPSSNFATLALIIVGDNWLTSGIDVAFATRSYQDASARFDFGGAIIHLSISYITKLQ